MTVLFFHVTAASFWGYLVRLLSELLSLFALYSFICIAMINRSINRDKLATIAVAISFPILSVIALGLTLKRPMSVRPCPVGLEDVEQAVEAKRQAMFGGQSRRTTIAHRWQQAYALHLEAQTRHIAKAANQLQSHLPA